MTMAARLKHYIETLPGFEFQSDGAVGYEHMGVLLVDATLLAGIKYETVDYLKILAGISTSAIDVHLYSFLEQAGTDVMGYEEAQGVIRETAVLMGVDERALDYSIWAYMAGG